MELTLSDAVADTAGVPLDGDWINPNELTDTGTSSFTTGSGDGTFGGDFTFRFTILPGDVNRNNLVDVDDLNEVRNDFGMTMATWTDGDTSGNTVVDIDDLNTVRNNFGLYDFTSWPGGAQAASGGGTGTLSAASSDDFFAALAALYATDAREGRDDDLFWWTLAQDDWWSKVLDEIRSM